MSAQSEYIARINRVIDHIESHLDQDLKLDNLSQIACFSPFHFHRVFKAIVGETLNQFIHRVRIEKAATQLLTNPDKTVTEIALDCGFAGSASFARAFKAGFGMSASNWRAHHSGMDSKIGKPKSNIGQQLGKNRKAFIESTPYIDSVTQNLTWRIQMTDQTNLKIEVKDLPAQDVAYVRHTGPYKGDEVLFEGLFRRLMTWAGPRGLCGPDAKVMAVYHDDPKITQEDKLRVSACLTIDAGTKVDGEIGKMKLEGGQYAVAHFELKGSHEYESAWDMVYGQWLPESGYQPDDRLCFELYHNDPKEDPQGIHIVDICVPVKPL